MIEKTEYPPILEPGFHEMSFSEFEEKFLDPFPDSKTRREISSHFKEIIETLQSNQIEGDLWANGSFVTKKEDPNDIDVVLKLQNSFVEKAPPQVHSTLAGR